MQHIVPPDQRTGGRQDFLHASALSAFFKTKFVKNVSISLAGRWSCKAGRPTARNVASELVREPMVAEATMMNYNTPQSVVQETHAYRDQLKRFRDGMISAAAFQDILARMGICEQREKDTYMVTIRAAAGVFLPHQLRLVANLARTLGNRIVHVTTGQGLQLHGVRLQDTPDILDDLLDAGLFCGCGDGNAVGNVSICPRAGVCPNEPFDVMPYALAMTEYLLRKRSSLELPAEFKVAFSGCGNDCGLCSVADLGFFATTKNGVPGFSVYAGGSMGANPALAILIEDFVPVKTIFPIAEAVQRLLNKRVDYGDHNRAGLRSIVEHLGEDGFRSLCRHELEDVQREGVDGPEVEPPPSTNRFASQAHQVQSDSTSFNEWRRRNTVPEHQEDLVTVELPLALGDISARALQMVTSLSEQYGDSAVHVTQNQDLQLRGVREADLYSLFFKLRRIGRKLITPSAVKFVACAGASVCRFGLCQSRGLVEAVEKELAGIKNRFDIPIYISGCPNACGRHPVAPIGLYGSTTEFGGRLVPSYTIVAGGQAVEGHAVLAESVAKVPARAVPLLLGDFFAEANTEYHDGESLDALMSRWGRDYLSKRSRRYRFLPSYEEAPEVYRDFGAIVDFSLTRSIHEERE
jgi:sulfite reductase (ferredoxin)